MAEGEAGCDLRERCEKACGRPRAAMEHDCAGCEHGLVWPDDGSAANCQLRRRSSETVLRCLQSIS